MFKPSAGVALTPMLTDHRVSADSPSPARRRLWRIRWRPGYRNFRVLIQGSRRRYRYPKRGGRCVSHGDGVVVDRFRGRAGPDVIHRYDEAAVAQVRAAVRQVSAFVGVVGIPEDGYRHRLPFIIVGGGENQLRGRNHHIRVVAFDGRPPGPGRVARRGLRHPHLVAARFSFVQAGPFYFPETRWFCRCWVLEQRLTGAISGFRLSPE